MNQIKIRDSRQKTMFRVDDEYLNGYARLCGTNATLVYLCLCRHADRKQESFPAIETMAKKLDVSRDSVMRGIKELTKWNIVSVERTRRPNKTWLNNIYTLLDKSVWEPKPSSTEQHGEPGRKNSGSQVANNATSQVAEGDTKDSHIKETNIRNAETSSADINSFFKRKGGDDGVPMSQLEFRRLCHSSPERHINILGIYARNKEADFTTRGQWRQFGLRNMRAALRLAPYTSEQFGRALQRISDAKKGDFLEHWSLETIEKYLD